MTFDIEKLAQFPTQPGVYMMIDKDGVILYVGKAKNLRQRVKQYFFPGRDGRMMVPYLVAKVDKVETIVVFSEKEALLLENNLIKQHLPRYNALLKDDKSYIALKLSLKEKWPSIKLVRYKGRPDPDGLYFGPYTSAKAARQTLDLLNRLFPLRRCSDQEMARRIRPCLLYDMKRCAGPCTNMCTEDEYQHHLKRTIKFLRGQDKEVLKDLYEEMERLSESMEFEKASRILESIRHIEKTIESQHVDKPLGHHADSIGLYREGEDVVVSVLFFRHGKLTGSKHFFFESIAEEDSELMTTFMMQHYDEKKLVEIPEEILLPIKVMDQSVLAELLQARFKQKLILSVPSRGDKKKLQQMAQVNAKAYFQSHRDEATFNEQLLLELQEKVALENYPSVIECFDTSHTSGSEPVASMIAFVEGKKESRRYRLYRLNNGSKSDDYAAMREVLSRRYKRAKEEGTLPDLVIVDGGRGQLGVAVKVFEELDIMGVDIIGLAKEEGRHDKGMTEEQVFLVNRKDPVILGKNSPILFLLQRMRDEAHRFALTFHRKRRSKGSLVSALDGIEGIGPTKKKALLNHFGSVKRIQEATLEELMEVKGISQKNAETLKKVFSLSS